MKSAAHVVSLLLEGGFESFDYSPEDLARYQQLRAQQQELTSQGRIVVNNEISPEWQANWAEYEKLRNKYNGMPPKQLGGL